MKACDIKRNLKEYQELYSINDKDEFLHCFVYELFIRDIKEYLTESLSYFYVDNKKGLGLTLKGLEYITNIDTIERYEDIFREVAIKFKNENETAYAKMIYVLSGIIEEDIFFYYGYSFENLYVDYFFFDEDIRELYNLLFFNKEKKFKKKIYNELMEIETFYKKDFIRTHTFMPKKNDDDFRDIQTKYYLKYKRPMRPLSSILGNNKKADIEINADLPKKIIMQQVEKLIDIILEDKKNIYSNIDKLRHTGEFNYQKYTNEIYTNKRQVVDALLIYDYVSLREKEVIRENAENEIKKINEIRIINHSIELDKEEKKISRESIKQRYKTITKENIKEELMAITELSYNTIDKYYKNTTALLQNKNYLKLLEGDFKDFKEIFPIQ